MHKSAWLFLCLTFYCILANAQEKGIAAISLSGGAMNYKGDLDDNLTIAFTKPGYAIQFLMIRNARLNFSLNYLHGEITASDAEAVNTGNKYRNLSFYSNIDEVSAQVIYRFQNRKNSFTQRQQWVPYLFAGISYFHFDPKRNVNGIEYDLPQTGTEGQHLNSTTTKYPEPYKLWQFSIPFGAGIKCKLAELIDLGLETGLRKTFTDYLDDVSDKYPDKNEMLSQEGPVALYLSDPSNDPSRPNGRKSFSPRGNPDKKDWYIYTNINITFYFTTRIYKSNLHFRNV